MSKQTSGCDRRACVRIVYVTWQRQVQGPRCLLWIERYPPRTTQHGHIVLCVTKLGVNFSLIMRISSNQWAIWAKEIRKDLKEMRQWLLRNEDVMFPFMLIFLCLGSQHLHTLASDEMRMKQDGDTGNTEKHYNTQNHNIIQIPWAPLTNLVKHKFFSGDIKQDFLDTHIHNCYNIIKAKLSRKCKAFDHV